MLGNRNDKMGLTYFIILERCVAVEETALQKTADAERGNVAVEVAREGRHETTSVSQK